MMSQEMGWITVTRKGVQYGNSRELLRPAKPAVVEGKNKLDGTWEKLTSIRHMKSLMDWSR